MKEFSPRSLLSFFDPPGDFLGCFGWVCGYSADASFMDAAVGRFTGRSQRNRAQEGRVALALMLDPGSPQILPGDAPGVAHLGSNTDAPPFRLMHAKVAILLFRHTVHAQLWRLRLVVSTGNWTRQTLEDSLDLVWSTEVDSTALPQPTQAILNNCADIKAAWATFSWLHGYYGTEVLKVEPRGAPATIGGRSPIESFNYCVQAVVQAAKATAPRFFDNRLESLQQQLPRKIGQLGAIKPRPYLALGSGFYEGGEQKDEVPPVLRGLVRFLQEQKLVHKDADVDVFVEPTACQAVAFAQRSIAAAGWRVRPPGKPDYFGGHRSLHAKFLFAAESKDGANGCGKAWIYLGSGNLTAPGFVHKASASTGNLEAGVIFAVEDLHWKRKKATPPGLVISNLLPIQRESSFEVDGEEGQLAPGTGMPERQIEYLAPPVGYLIWQCVSDQGSLTQPPGERTKFDVMCDDRPCVRGKGGRYLWPAAQPRQVMICWEAAGRQYKCVVPVVDGFRRVAGVALPALGFESIWNDLIDFPLAPDDDEDNDLNNSGDDDQQNGGNKKKPDEPQSRKRHQGTYPIRQMMELIEQIAEKQTTLAIEDWMYWCSRLEQTLTQTAGSDVVEDFRQRRLNPLGPLWRACFRPDFAANSGTAAGKTYEDMLHRIEQVWGLSTCDRLGDSQ